MDHIEINYMEFSRSALQRNARTICHEVKVPVIAMLKCDGYGISLTEAARIWQEAGAALFAVAQPHEALALRRAGFSEDILLTSPVGDSEMIIRLLYHDIILTVTSAENAALYRSCASRFPIRAHVAVDTGMGRFGVSWRNTDELKAIYALTGFSFEGIFSHFAQSFEPNYRHTKVQLDRFLTAIDALAAQGISVGLRHIANSCAALRFPETRLDAVRIGSALLGRLCCQSPVPLVPVGTFKAQIVDIKHLQKGDTTGYGSLCRVRCDTAAAVVAIGRENGFGLADVPEALPLRFRLRQWLKLLWQQPPCVCSPRHPNHPLPLIGRIGTQYTLFDATGLSLRPGDYVTAQVPLLFSGHRKRLI